MPTALPSRPRPHTIENICVLKAGLMHGVIILHKRRGEKAAPGVNLNPITKLDFFLLSEVGLYKKGSCTKGELYNMEVV